MDFTIGETRDPPEASVAGGVDARRLERDASERLAEALRATLHEPGERDRHRRLLAEASELSLLALELAGDPETLAGARSTLVKAHAAKAEDALHGAGQLSLSAQRAPTREACDDGWQRVEVIVCGAEASARAAAAIARDVSSETPDAKLARVVSSAAARADVAARSARRLVETRNHAYTFHTDGDFSFGEGWYLAAAAVLDGVAIQIESGTDGTASAEAFLRDAGLASRLEAYRSRPRAMKQTTELVGRSFRADAVSAQQRLRAAFLGAGPTASAVLDFVDARLERESSVLRDGKKVLLWIRDGVHHPGRNTDAGELRELTRRVSRAGLVPVWTGDAVRGGEPPPGVIDFILFWKEPPFRGPGGRRAQLQCFEYLRQAYGLVGQLGVTTAGMDGPALMGLPTVYLTDAPNVRMREWVGAVPGYREVVRGDGYLERVSDELAAWAWTSP